MNILKQLLRQPLRTLAAVLALSTAGAFLCLSFGMFLSAKATVNRVEANFITIALPTSETELVKVDMENGLTGSYETSAITNEMWTFLAALPENCPAVKGAYRQSFTSAWSPALFTTLSAQEPGRYRWWLDAPYTDAAFVVTFTEIGEMESLSGTLFAANPDGEAIPDLTGIPDTVWVTVTAVVEQAVLLHPGYTPRDTLSLRCTFGSQAELEAAGLAVGGRYLVYGMDYIDHDLAVRTGLAEIFRCSPEEIDWDNLNYDVSESEIVLSLIEHGETEAAQSIVALLHLTEELGWVSMSQDELDSIGRAGLSVAAKDARFSVPMLQLDGTDGSAITEEEASVPTIISLEGDVDGFLSSPVGVRWRTAIQQARMRWQCVPVLGTDYLESIYLFQQRDAFLVDGRTFTAEEYQSGARVCILPEQVALSSGLSVGDRIEMSWYSGVDANTGLFVNDHNLTAQVYSRTAGISGEPVTYEIIGVYRHSNLWEEFSYAFTPNTVFVPNKSISVQTRTGGSGVFYTLVLENGGIEAVRAALAAQGYPEDTLLYYDNGYTEFAGTLESFEESVVRIFLASILAWLAVLVGYLVLFIRRQRRNAWLMLSLGAGKANARRFVFSLSILLTVLAAVPGVICSSLLLSVTLQWLFDATGEVLSTAFSIVSAGGHAQLMEQSMAAVPLACASMAVMQLLLYAVVIWLYAGRISRTSDLRHAFGNGYQA